MLGEKYFSSKHRQVHKVFEYKSKGWSYLLMEYLIKKTESNYAVKIAKRLTDKYGIEP